MKIVSACLVGINCTFNGKNNSNKKLMKMLKNGELIPICPEQVGGLSTPRKPAGVFDGTGEDVIQGKATVRASRGDGEDITKEFVKGAEEVLKIVNKFEIKEAVLKQKSPSCGCGKVWQVDNKFINHVVNGDGVLTALLKKNGIKVVSEEEFL